LRSIFLFLLTSLLFLPLLVVPAHAGLADRVVAWVDDQPVTLTEVEESAVHYQSQGLVPSGPLDEPLLRQALDLFIDDLLLLKQADRLGIEMPAEFIDNRVGATIRQLEEAHGGRGALDTFLRQGGLARSDMRDQLRRWTDREWRIIEVVSSRVAISNEDIDRFVEERWSAGLPVRRYVLSHLFLPLPAAATDAEKEETLGRARSALESLPADDGFTSASLAWAEKHRRWSAQGGALGVVTPSDLQAELVLVAEKMKPGQTSEPILTSRGAHVLHLVRETTPREMLFSKRFEEEREKWLEQLRRNVMIDTVDRLLPEDSP